MQQFSQICTEDGENDRGGKEPSIICPGRNTAESHHQPKQEQGTELVASC